MNAAKFHKLLQFGADKYASDIHFEVNSPPCYRIKGDLLRAKHPPLTREDTEAIAQILLKDRNVETSRFFPEQDTSYSLPGVSRFRVTVFRQRGSVGCVLRVIPFKIREFDELNLLPVLKDISSTPRGLLLVTGATGMGKSTTIAAILNYINKNRQEHIVTIEDPIEFLFENSQSLIIQREVGTDTQSYRDGMLAALRQDPDVIMLGEVRDDVTADVCLKAAETGHLVITTLHTPDTLSSIKRFMGFFPQGQHETKMSRLADILQAAVSLRLLKKADGTGLVPAIEVLRVTHTIQECIRNVDRHGEIADHISKGREMYGMQTFDQHLKELVRNQVVSLEVAKTAATKPANLERALMID